MERGVRRTLAAGIVAAMTAASAQGAAMNRESVRLHFELTETPLAEALLRYSELTGLGLVFDSRLVDGHTAPAISGDYSARAALDQLLAGTGLRIERIGTNILTIVPAVPVAQVVSAADNTEAPVQYAAAVEAPIDELLIIGTRTANPPYFKFVPSASLEGEELKFSGIVNVSDDLFQLPSMLSDITSANTTAFGTPAGLNLADLRGIGTQRTLVLVNGRRYTPTYGGNLTVYGVDLNSISASLIERIEVLTGGAATSHGGDAVAGVINFVMRDKYDGFNVAVQGGITDGGDREEFLATATYGTEFADGRGNLVASLSLDRQNGLLMDDRHVTSDPSGYALNGRSVAAGTGVFTRGYGRSSVTPNGDFFGYIDGNGEVAYTDRYYFNADGTDYARGTGGKQERYRFAVDHTLLTPIKRIFGTFGGKYDVASGHRLIIETSFVDNHVESQLAPLPLTDNTGLVGRNSRLITVPLSNPYVPPALIDDLLADDPGATALLLNRRATELGPRKTDIARRNYRAMLGLQGVLGQEWTYDVYYQFGRNAIREERDGLMYIEKYQTALDPDLCAAVTGCNVINPFGAGNISEADAAFYRAPNAIRHIRADQHIASAVASGPIALPTGTDATLSGGLEYRYESLKDKPDPVLDSMPVAGSFVFPGSDGSFDAIEAFADLTVSILEDLTFARELTLTGGVRASDFSSVGTQGIWHVGAFWEPFDGIMFRLSYQDGKRAPNIAELYAGGPATFLGLVDPCSAPNDAVIIANCGSGGPLGVPAGYEQSEFIIEAQGFGNPALDAESATNLTVGFTLDTTKAWPEFPGNLRLSVDAFRIKAKDFIVSLDADEILDICYRSDGLSSLYCGDNPATGRAFIQRDATGNLQVVSGALANAGRYWLEGFDIDLQYLVDLRSFDLPLPIDSFSLVGRYSHNHEVKGQYRAGGEIMDELGEAKYPRHRFQIGASFVRGDVTVDWDIRYRGAATSFNEAADLPDAHIAAVWYHDLAVRWEMKEDTVFYAGVRNLFDRKAPRFFGGSVGDTMPEYYDVMGRRFFTGFVFDF